MTKDLPDYLSAVLGEIASAYDAMASAFNQPQLVGPSGMASFRYPQQSDTLLCFLKGVKIISTLNGAVCLLRAGHAQEIGALCRVADECADGILYMFKPNDGDKLDKSQQEYLADFFQEEFADNMDPFGSRQTRRGVSRKTISAAFGKTVNPVLNRSDAQKVHALIYGTFSGYVHGAYPHIMELYGGQPARFHVAGMLGTPRMIEFSEQMVGQVYRAIMASELVSRKIGHEEARKVLRALLVRFETEMECKPTAEAEKLMQKVKNKK